MRAALPACHPPLEPALRACATICVLPRCACTTLSALVRCTRAVESSPPRCARAALTTSADVLRGRAGGVELLGPAMHLQLGCRAGSPHSAESLCSPQPHPPNPTQPTGHAPAAPALCLARPAPGPPAAPPPPGCRPARGPRAAQPALRPARHCLPGARRQRPARRGSGRQPRRTGLCCARSVLHGRGRGSATRGGRPGSSGSRACQQHPAAMHASIQQPCVPAASTTEISTQRTQQHLHGRHKVAQQRGEARQQRRQPRQLLRRLQHGSGDGGRQAWPRAGDTCLQCPGSSSGSPQCIPCSPPAPRCTCANLQASRDASTCCSATSTRRWQYTLPSQIACMPSAASSPCTGSRGGQAPPCLWLARQPQRAAAAERCPPFLPRPALPAPSPPG